ncbi:hypothetical protein Lepto1489_23805 (plasmid) [Leptospira interrogans serovar Bataviae]|uniref:Uncharacterized protein n=1 Tax=Leptospira interrogans serovar Bataviae TaxID=312175 RepID=A0AAP9WTC3_LEPIR|nr:hypothetical protein Lepto1489_23805 [Leptospira interrogans serovar Bataviae]
MLFSNELNYWVIKKIYLRLRLRAPYQNRSQNYLSKKVKSNDGACEIKRCKIIFRFSFPTN